MRVSLLLHLVLVAPAAGQGALWIVDDDGGPGVDFTDLQPAIDGAADGDVLLVRQGTYGGFTANGRTLAIVSDEAVRPRAESPARILGVPASGWFVLQGLELRGLGSGVDPGLEIASCSGPVRLEDCKVTSDQFEYLVVSGCAAVDLTRCDVGEPEIVNQTLTATGLDVTDSAVSVHESSIAGSQTNTVSFFGLLFPPGDGVRVRGASLLYVADSTLTGGSGIDAVPNPFSTLCQSQATDGGDGLVLESGNPQVFLRDTTLVGGPPGDHIGVIPGVITCTGTPADPGDELTVVSGSAVTVPGSLRAYRASSPVLAGGAASLNFQGEPGDFAISLATTTPTFLWLAPYAAPLLVDPLAFVSFLGVVPGGGELAVTIPVDPLPPGWGSGVLFLQGVAFDAGLGGHVGSPALLVMTATP